MIRQIATRLRRRLRRSKERKLCSPHFDTAWYLARYPDVSQTGTDPLDHFLVFGAVEARDPNPSFDSAWYLETNPDVAASGINPFVHYLTSGASEGRKPCPDVAKLVAADGSADADSAEADLRANCRPLFDADWYRSTYLQGVTAETDPFDHFFAVGAALRYDPNPFFSTRWYLGQFDAPGDVGPNALADFVRFGAAQDRSPHPLFDPGWYLETYADVAAAGAEPFRHFIESGSSEGRDPHPLFSTRWYLEHLGDGIREDIRPLFHYLAAGAGSPLSPHPLFDGTRYLGDHPAVALSGEIPLVHYLTTGGFEGLDPNAFFRSAWYLDHYPEARASGLNPLVHYVKIGAPKNFDPGPVFSTTFYRVVTPGVGLSNPLSYYLALSDRDGIQTQAPEARNKIALVFLARSEQGSTLGLNRFVRSYRHFKPDVDHDLIVLRKGGMRKSGARFALQLMLEGIDVQYLDLDDGGFDIQAYIRAAKVLPHEYVCFLNTHSEIMCEGWLRKLYEPLLSKAVGVTGATASYESLTDSMELSDKAIVLTHYNRIPYDEALANVMSERLAPHAPEWLKQGNLAAIDAHDASEAIAGALRYDAAVGHAKHWESVTGPGGPLFAHNTFKRFPNPHIRTNAFMMRRDVLVGLGFDLDDSKLACLEVESGKASLQARLEQNGLRAVLVGADGRHFNVEQWPESNTFRLGDQRNILVADNRVREFDTASERERRLLVAMTWGRYIGEVPDALVKFGYPFKKGDLRLPAAPLPLPPAQASAVTISIVIPTHGRLALVKEALATIVAQSYPHWECIVFDNASDEPVEEHVAQLGDERIKSARSDVFLPVTDSWNAAIDRATGDYVLLIGDDDGLVPHSLERLAELVDRFDRPDLVYTSFFQFFHPGVAPWEPSGSVAETRSGFFFSDSTEEFLLSKESARLAVVGSLQLRRSFAFNMQAQVFECRFLDRLRKDGKVFQSPFPDYYVANVAFAEADRIVVSPRPLTVAGVSRKSFGFTLFNNMPEKGESLLNTSLRDDPFYQKLKDRLLPGPPYNTNYIVTMEHVADRLQGRIESPVRVDRYRRLQILQALGGKDEALGGGSDGNFRAELLPLLDEDERNWAEWLQEMDRRARSGDAGAGTVLEAAKNKAAMYAPYKDVVWAKTLWVGDFADLPQLFDRLERTG